MLLSRSRNLFRVTLSRSFSNSRILSAEGDELHTVGPWPKTKEEREKAAKKYNLIPEDYEPYEYGWAMGDYPKLPPIGAFNRDPYEDFDDVEEKRNHGEVMHRDYDLYMYERLDPLEREKPDYIRPWKVFLTFFSIGLSVPTIWWLNRRYRLNFNHQFKQRKILVKNNQLYEFPCAKNDHSHH